MGIEACRTGSNGTQECHDTGGGGNGDDRVTSDEAATAIVAEGDYNSADTAMRDRRDGSTTPTNYRLANIPHAEHPSPTWRAAGTRTAGSWGFGFDFHYQGDASADGDVTHTGGGARARVDRFIHPTSFPRALNITVAGTVGGVVNNANVTLPGGNSGQAQAGGFTLGGEGGVNLSLYDRYQHTLSLGAFGFARFVYTNASPTLRYSGTPSDTCAGSPQECVPQENTGVSDSGQNGIGIVSAGENGVLRSLLATDDLRLNLGAGLDVNWVGPNLNGHLSGRTPFAPFARAFFEAGGSLANLGPNGVPLAFGIGGGVRVGGNLDHPGADPMVRLRGQNLDPNVHVDVDRRGVLRVYVPNTNLGGNNNPLTSSVSVASPLNHWEDPQRFDRDGADGRGGIDRSGVHIPVIPSRADQLLSEGKTVLVRQDTERNVRPFIVTARFAARFNGQVNPNQDGSVTLPPMGGADFTGAHVVAVNSDGVAFGGPLASIADQNGFHLTDIPQGAVALRVVGDGGHPVQQTNLNAPTTVTNTQAPRSLAGVTFHLGSGVIVRSDPAQNVTLGSFNSDSGNFPNNAGCVISIRDSRGAVTQIRDVNLPTTASSESIVLPASFFADHADGNYTLEIHDPRNQVTITEALTITSQAPAPLSLVGEPVSRRAAGLRNSGPQMLQAPVVSYHILPSDRTRFLLTDMVSFQAIGDPTRTRRGTNIAIPARSIQDLVASNLATLSPDGKSLSICMGGSDQRPAPTPVSPAPTAPFFGPGQISHNRILADQVTLALTRDGRTVGTLVFNGGAVRDPLRGRPPVNPNGDNDHDGVINSADRCSRTPAGARVAISGARTGCAPGQTPRR